MSPEVEDQQPVIQPQGSLSVPQGPAPNDRLQTLQTPGADTDQLAPSRFEQFGNYLKLASDQSAIGIPGFADKNPGWVTRALSEKVAALDAVPKMTPEEANKAYPGMPEPFNQAISPEVAKLQWDHYQRTQSIQSWVAAGGSSPTLQFTSGVVAGFTDPLNIGLGVATGELSKLAGLTSTLRNVFLQNLGINAGLAAGGYAVEKSEHLAPSALDSAAGAVEGSIGGTLFHYAAGMVANAFRTGLDTLRRTPPDIRESNMRQVMGQIAVGARPSIDFGMSEQAIRSTGLSTAPGLPMDEGSFWAAKDASGKNLNLASQEMGPGLSLSKSEGRANNASANPGDLGGVIGRFNVEDHNLLDLEQPASNEEGKKLFKDIPVGPDETIKEAINRLDNNAARGTTEAQVLETFQSNAKEAGFDGYHFMDDGVEHAHLFDGGIQPEAFRKSDPESVPQSTADARMDAFKTTTESPETQETYDPKREEENHEFRKGPPLNAEFTPDYMDPIHEEQYAQATGQLDQWAKEDPALAKEVEALKSENKTDNVEKSLMSQLADCLKGALS